jgi:signal transduction histidine kinase/DNA-binding response OmpR family regulator/ligand-binding sensor domain-containing protein
MMKAGWVFSSLTAGVLIKPYFPEKEDGCFIHKHAVFYSFSCYFCHFLPFGCFRDVFFVYLQTLILPVLVMIVIRKILFVLLFPIITIVSVSAFFDKNIRVLTMQNGLADNMVYCIHKDQNGFMWFGTNNGLSRYDGRIIHNFTLPDRYLSISHIRETDNHLLWLVTSANLMCFDLKTEKMLPVKTDQRWNDVIFTGDSTVWALSERSVCHFQIDYRYDPNGDLSEIRLNLLKEESFTSDTGRALRAFCLSADGLLFITTSHGDIITYDPGTERIVKERHLIDELDLQMHRLLYKNGRVWLSTIAHGAIVYDPETGRHRQYTYRQPSTHTSISHHDVYQMVVFPDGNFLAATWNGYTLLKPDPEDRLAFTTEIYNNTTSRILQNLESRMISAYYDPAGVLWIGTRGGGVYASDLRLQFYERYYQDSHNEICDITNDAEGHLWIAGFHKGVMRSRKPFSPSEELTFEPVAVQAGPTVLCMVTDHRGDIWFGGRNNQLTCYSRGNKAYSSYPVVPDGDVSWKGEVWSLLVDGGNIWMGTTAGLILFDMNVRLFFRYEDRFGVIRAIAKDGEGYLWLGTSNGVMKFSPVEKKVVERDLEKRNRISTSEVRSLLISKDRHLYVGYVGGFGVISLANDGLERFYTTRDGLCSNFIGCMEEDPSGDIWLGSNSGITRFNRDQQLFYNYYISGSNRSAFLFGAYLFFGNNLNLTYFDPERVKVLHDTSEKVRITQLEVDSKPVGIGEEINEQVLLDEGTTYTRHLSLNQQNNNFSLSFSNLTFSEELQKYSYRLFPYQTEWISSNEGEKATYSNLPQGTYTFEVKNIFPDGATGEVTSVVIAILPHWYDTILSRLVFIVLLLLLLVWLVSRLKRKQMRMAKEERLKHELVVANLERRKEKQIFQERENFFTNVSHELRTPLTLILSPLQELLNNEKISPPVVHEKLRLMYNNAVSLSTLMNQLLYVQKIEAGMVRLRLSQTDIVPLVRKIAASFVPMAGMKKINFRWFFRIDSMPLWMDAGKIESAIKNLLSNAFKYTPEGKQIVVSVDPCEIDGQTFCLIEVKDTGPGIRPDLQEKVFESFITGPGHPSFSTKVGIGLRIVKNTMDLHHGKVVLRSEAGDGASFTLYIPAGKEHFRDEEYDEPEPETVPVQVPAGFIHTISADPDKKGKSGKILVIEDNEEMRSYIRSLFEKDYEVVEARDGAEGVEKAKRELPDLVLSDIMMPVKDGIECSDEIKKDPLTAHIPVIMLTAKAEDADVIRSIRVGADDYIMKPFNPEILKAKAGNLIRSREQLKRIYTKTFMLRQHPEDSDPENQEKERFMQQIIRHVELNLLNPDFSAKILAGYMNLSQPTLYRKIKQYTDMSIIEVIRSVRISKAASLIMQKKYSIQEVCEMVGYNDLTTFRKHFFNQFGVLPSRYGDM